jgi:hypothetical protein
MHPVYARMHPLQYHGKYHNGVAAMTVITWAQPGDRRVWLAEAPSGELLVVTQTGRTSWTPAVLDSDGRTRWRGTPCLTRLEAQRYAEGQVSSGSEPEGGDRQCPAE